MHEVKGQQKHRTTSKRWPGGSTAYGNALSMSMPSNIRSRPRHCLAKLAIWFARIRGPKADFGVQDIFTWQPIRKNDVSSLLA